MESFSHIKEGLREAISQAYVVTLNAKKENI